MSQAAKGSTKRATRSKDNNQGSKTSGITGKYKEASIKQ